MNDHLIIKNYKKIEGLSCDISKPTEMLSKLHAQKRDLEQRILNYEDVRVASTRINDIADIVIEYFQKIPELQHIKFCNIRVAEPCDTHPHFIFTHNTNDLGYISFLDGLGKEFKKLGNNFDLKFSHPRIIWSGPDFFHIVMDKKPQR